MTTIKTHSVAFTGVDAVQVEVEVQKTRGLFGKISMVGLPSSAVKESRDRVRAAIQSSGFPFPRSALVINMAPADIKKEGPSFDLPLAMAILAAEGVIPDETLRGITIIGELALDGRVKPVRAALAAAILARSRNQRGILLAPENLREAELVKGLSVLPTPSLQHAVSLFGGPPCADGEAEIRQRVGKDRDSDRSSRGAPPTLDYRDVMGQEMVKQAMIVAAAGGHNLLMIGPPGCGKTMLARRHPTILPQLNRRDALEVSRIHSFRSNRLIRLIEAPPFRAPHHTISHAGLVGGGSLPGPGEISLAHKGVLFLDELPEFGRRTLEALRQPLEEGVVTIARARGVASLPAQLSLLASMNPCPCGFRGDGLNRCTCTERQAMLYLRRISGPLLDRLDLQVEVPLVDPMEIQTGKPGLDSGTMAARVSAARNRQVQRNHPQETRLNAHLSPEEIRRFCDLDRQASNYLKKTIRSFPLSARGYSRILKVARTVADLDDAEKIHRPHLEQAVMLRVLDRMKTLEGG